MPNETAAGEFLQGYTNAALGIMAKTRGINPVGKGKAKLVQLLSETLFNPSRITEALAELEPLQRAVLDRVILAGGMLPTQVLRAALEHEHLIEHRPAPRPYGYYAPEKGSAYASGSRKLEDILARLCALGLVFTTGASSGRMYDLVTPGQRIWIPPQILQHLPPVTVELVTAEPPAEIVAGNAAALQRDLYTLLSFAGRQDIPLTMRGQIMKRALVKLDPEMLLSEVTPRTRSEDELGRIPFLRALAEDLGLLSASVGTLAPSPGIQDYLRRPAGERLAQLYQTYRDTARFNELYRIPSLRILGKGFSVRLAPPRIIDARQRVLREIAELPVGEWISLEHLIDRLRQRDYEFLLERPVRDLAYYYYGSADINPYASGNQLGLIFDGQSEGEGWLRVEAGMIRVIVTEALAWLGVVDLGWREGEPAAFRVTEAGAHLLRGEAPAAEAVPTPNVVVQPNFQLFAFEPTSEDILFMLDRVAERVRAEQAIEYALTRDSIYRGQQSGLDIAEIIAFLERVSTVELPQNVRRTLAEWGAQHERVTLRRGVGLLHAVDAETLDALYADPELGPLLGRRAAPSAALVPVANLHTLLPRLLAAGQLPALSEGDDLTPRPVFRIDGEGRVTFRQRLPSIQVLRVLRPLTGGQGEPAPGDTPRLTAESLRRAARGGLSAEAIIDSLARFHAGPLPEEVAALVKRWARDWGKGALVEAVLLQLERPELLDDLLADPLLKPHLRRVPGAPAFALVRPDALEPVRAALEERGMPLQR
ncbi:MAG TPA: helicase-associated domain-containing protein, partial [Thermomicrobiaceae bacterium]|nr:helicase-associated domain-containing protein [Thermomicrobiaceae bacterium]